MGGGKKKGHSGTPVAVLLLLFLSVLANNLLPSNPLL